jgi:hypothetical protein
LEEVPGLFVYLGKGAEATHPAQTILSVVAVFAAAFGVERLFFWYTAAFRRRLLSDQISGWREKMGKLFLRAGINGIAATLLIFFLFTKRNTAQRVPVATYLAAIVVVRMSPSACRPRRRLRKRSLQRPPSPAQRRPRWRNRPPRSRLPPKNNPVYRSGARTGAPPGLPRG